MSRQETKDLFVIVLSFLIGLIVTAVGSIIGETCDWNTKKTDAVESNVGSDTADRHLIHGAGRVHGGLSDVSRLL